MCQNWYHYLLESNKHSLLSSAWIKGEQLFLYFALRHLWLRNLIDNIKQTLNIPAPILLLLSNTL